MSLDTAVASRCLGCAPTILDVGHLCGGNRIPTAELGWWCDCPEPECRRRQAGEWPKNERRSQLARRR